MQEVSAVSVIIILMHAKKIKFLFEIPLIFFVLKQNAINDSSPIHIVFKNKKAVHFIILSFEVHEDKQKKELDINLIKENFFNSVYDKFDDNIPNDLEFNVKAIAERF